MDLVAFYLLHLVTKCTGNNEHVQVFVTRLLIPIKSLFHRKQRIGTVRRDRVYLSRTARNLDTLQVNLLPLTCVTSRSGEAVAPR